MKKRIKLKNLLLTVSLSFAGLFGIGSLAFSTENNDVMKAEAATAAYSDPVPDYIFIRIATDTGNIKNSAINQCQVQYWSSSGMGGSKRGEVDLGTCLYTVGSYTYAKAKVTRNTNVGEDFLVNDGTGSGGKSNLTENQDFYEGYDTFVVTTNGSDATLWIGGQYVQGFHSKIICFDLSESEWASTNVNNIQFSLDGGSSFKTSLVSACSNYFGYTSSSLCFFEIPGVTNQKPDTAASSVILRVGSSGTGKWMTSSISLKPNSNYVYKLSSSESSPGASTISLNDYKVSFNANGHGVAPDSQDVPYAEKATTPVSPSVDYYNFGGWYKEADCTNAWTFGSDIVRDNITLYAKWTAKTYTIAYNLGGGSASNPGAYTVETSTFTLNNPTRSGYIFVGWTGSNGDVPQRTVTIPTGSYGERTYNANWRTNEGYWFIGTESNWNINNAIPLASTSGTEYACRTQLTGGNRGKIVHTNSSKTIDTWYNTTSVYCAMPQDYPISIYSPDTSDAAAYYSNSGTYDIYFDTNDAGKVSFNPVATLTFKVNGTTVGTLVRDDTGKDGDVLSQFKLDGYTAVKDGVIAIYLDNAVSPLTVIRTADAHNNVYDDSGVLKFSNECSTTIYMKFKASSRELYQKGWATTDYGVKTGNSFYVYDPNNQWSTASPQVFVKFECPTNDSYDKCWIVACGASFDETNKVWSCDVPGLDGDSSKKTTWTKASILRYAPGATTDGQTITGGTYWNATISPGTFSSNVFNAIKITGYEAGEYYLYSDGGIASGRGFYLNWSAKARWGEHTTKFAIYFYGTLDNAGANAWSEFMTLVPGETNVYETVVPQFESADVEWIHVIAVACPNDAATPTWSSGNEYQTQDFFYSKALAENQYIVLDGSLDGEYKAHGDLTTDYTDTTRANRWGTNFIDTNVKCDGYGSITTDNWSTSKDDYNAASPVVKEMIKTASKAGTSDLNKAVERYDYILHKYPGEHEDFAKRTAPGGGYSYGMINSFSPFSILGEGEISFSTIIIIVASSVSLLSITALSVILVKKRKRKEQ